MRKTLTALEKSIILKTDRAACVSALSAFLSSHPADWQPMAIKAPLGIKANHRPGKSAALSSHEIAQFLAMAAPTHCANGWAFFSRALHCALAGDAHAAWHFAYYAELRAAQSILSASGCGVFDSWNCILDDIGACQVIDDPGKNPLPTHVMTWRAMEALLDPSNATAIEIANTIQFNSDQLGDIVSAAFPGTPAWRNTFTWITAWLFDLSQGVQDKAMRNLCSYQPHEITKHTLSADEGVAFLDHLWNVFTPEPGATFSGIDKFLLREALSVEAKNTIVARGTPQPSREEIKQELEIAYDRMVSAFPALPISQEFITKSINRSDPPILTHARDLTGVPTSPLPILARAALFLRLATGVSEKLLYDSGVSDPAQLDFWLQKLALERGFIDSAVPFDGWSDLFGDIQVAMEELARLRENKKPLERAQLLSIYGVQRACEAERIAFWGLAA